MADKLLTNIADDVRALQPEWIFIMSVLFDRKVDQSRIEGIVIVVGSPAYELDGETAKKYYGQMNNAWSGEHPIHILKTSEKLEKMDDCVTASIADCIAFKAVPADHTLIIQPVKGPKANFCFCTYLAEKNHAADDSLISIWEGAIPFKRQA